MQVKNIECQIAQAQLRRYLTGEEMPNTIWHSMFLTCIPDNLL